MFWLAHSTIEERLKAITFLNLSIGSVAAAAKVKYLGADDHRSTTRWIELRASKILMGREI